MCHHSLPRANVHVTLPLSLAFPAGNGGSMEKCRRRWDLAEAEFLKYKFMYAFDRAMNHLDKVRVSVLGPLGAVHVCFDRCCVRPSCAAHAELHRRECAACVWVCACACRVRRPCSCVNRNAELCVAYTGAAFELR
jgi:hypothetical protein